MSHNDTMCSMQTVVAIMRGRRAHQRQQAQREGDLNGSQSVERTAGGEQGAPTSSIRLMRLALTVVVFALASCEEVKEPPQTSPSAPRGNSRGFVCPDDSVAKCVARYSKPELSPADIARFEREGRDACFDMRDKRKLASQGACLPLRLGRDARNGKTVEVVYACSDVCPAQGTLVTRYAGVARDECCPLGGHPTRDSAWGGYRGCTPPEVPLPKFNYSREPGGPMELASRLPCQPSQITFEDGTIITERRGPP